MSETVENVLRARALQIVDSKGETRIQLDTYEDGPRFTLFDDDGRGRMTIRLQDGKPRIAFELPGGLPWFYIGPDSDNGKNDNVVWFFNNENVPAIRAEIPADGPAHLMVFDEKGEVAWCSRHKRD